MDTINNARANCGSLVELAEMLGLKPLEAGTPEIINKLLDKIEQEVVRYYQKCPIDSGFTPIHIGDALKGGGKVVGIGDDCIFDEDKPIRETFSGYAVFAAGSVTVREITHAYRLVELILRESGGELSDTKKDMFATAIEGFEHVG